MVLKAEVEMMTMSGMADRVLIQTISDNSCDRKTYKAVYSILRSTEGLVGRSQDNSNLFNMVLDDVKKYDYPALEGTSKFTLITGRCNSVLSVKVYAKYK